MDEGRAVSRDDTGATAAADAPRQPAAPAQLNAAQRKRVRAEMPSVTALARALAPRMSHVSVDELQSAGFEGLAHAALRYDPAEGVPFGAFAHYRVRGAMLDLARRAAPEIRRRSRAVRALEATQSLLEQAERGLPTGEDPRTLRERVAAAADVVAQATAAVVMSKAAPADPDTVGTDSSGADEALIRREDHEALDEVLQTCTDDERALLDALYHRGLSMGEYATARRKNKSTISRQHAKLLARLAKRLRNHQRDQPPDDPPGHPPGGSATGPAP